MGLGRVGDIILSPLGPAHGASRRWTHEARKAVKAALFCDDAKLSEAWSLIRQHVYACIVRTTARQVHRNSVRSDKKQALMNQARFIGEVVTTKVDRSGRSETVSETVRRAVYRVASR
jgi:hypothetical protein